MSNTAELRTTPPGHPRPPRPLLQRHTLPPPPAIVVEAGFLTNAGDAARLTSPAGRRALAAAIAEGVASLAGGAG